MNDSKKIWYFNDFNLLDTLSTEEKMRISKMVTDKEVGRKEKLYLSEDTADKVFFLKKGKVKISKYSEEGKELIVSILGPGEVFGETGVIDSNTHDEVAEVMEDAVVCTIKVEDMQKMLTSNPEFNLSVTKLIGLKYKKIQSRLESLVFKTAPQRIRGFIKEMADEHGQNLINGEIVVKLKLKHEDIAKLTATTRQSVTSELNKLQKEGIITYDRKRILIRDYKKI